MNKKLLKPSLFFLFMFFAASFVKSQVRITSFTPASGGIGTSVTITGTGFGTTPAENTVYIGGKKVNVTAASATSLTITTTGGISYSPITVINTTTNLSGRSLANFTPTFSGPATISEGYFAPVFSMPVNGTVQGSAAVGDMDGDGKVDIVFSARFGSNISILRNTGTGTAFSFAPQVEFATLDQPYHVSIGDIDGDGKLDMVSTGGNAANESITIFRNTSTPGNLSFTKSAIDWSFIGYSALVDFDGDGKPELLVGHTGGQMGIFQNTSTVGNVSFNTAAPILTTGFGFYNTKASLGDIDNDGKIDIVSGFGANMTIMRNTSTGIGNISFAAPLVFPTYLDAMNTITADLNGDGKIDVVTMRDYGWGGGVNQFTVFQNTTTAGTISFTSADYDAGDPTGLTAADFNGDGKVDLYFSNVNVQNGPNPPTLIFQNTTTGSPITLSSRIEVGAYYSTQLLYFSTVGDLNGDGKPEAIAFDDNLRIYSMTGVLPVQLTAFNAALLNGKVKLDWNTSEESNVEKYEIQKSIDGKNFSKIMERKANNADNSSYVAYDENVRRGTSWYRLYIRTKDNHNKYSNIVSVKNADKGESMEVFPNPVVNNQLNVQLNAEKGEYSVRLINNDGKTVWSNRYKHDGGSVVKSFELPFIAKGNYTLVMQGAGNNFVQHLVF